MKYSKLFGKTVKEAPRDAVLTSHKLLYQAGFIRESTAGRYYLLPLGWRVHQKIQQIIKEEMDRAGAQEMVTPVLHPKELWKETNRTTSVGFELMSIKDRNDAEFVLGGTAEEMLVDLVRKFQISYKDLPFNLYQFSTKFRDEMRARGGLLRVREFTMKDAYSFHTTEEDFKKEYENMKNTYTRIFDRLGLKTIIVESDNGYIGGEYCHEFVVESEVGESRFLTTENGSYAAHEDVAVFKRDDKNIDEELLPIKEVEAVRGTTMLDGVKLHNKPLWQQIKDVLFVNEKGRFILSIIRGDYDVNEVKLMHLVKAYQLRHATDEEIRNIIHSEPGFISPVGIKEIISAGTELVVVADLSLRTIKNAYGGANKKHRDLFNMNIDRDYKPDIEGDIALAKEGYVISFEPEGSQSLNGLVSETRSGSEKVRILDSARMTERDGMTKKLISKKGIEVGNIFQLGFHYSSKMKGATFMDEDGQEKPYYMGCYGIGIGRTLATIAEVYNDEKGMIWPGKAAPYQAHLIQVQSSKFKVQSFAEEVYKKLKDANIEILFDDREDVSAGAKFADADLIGIPVRLLVSERTRDKIEWKERSKKETELLTVDEVLNRLSSN
ncbi:MAG: proline--tRNA ligase [Candidatus Levybacteria bacterium]|nr:proline--tRNA ligase [Candidatus Levybacteria bacterium]